MAIFENTDEVKYLLIKLQKLLREFPCYDVMRILKICLKHENVTPHFESQNNLIGKLQKLIYLPSTQKQTTLANISCHNSIEFVNAEYINYNQNSHL